MSTENYGLADLMAAVDKLAVYQALAILFPLAARARALQAIETANASVDDIVAWANLPANLVRLVLDKDWPELHKGVFSL